MKKSIKKCLSVLLASILVLSCASGIIIAYADNLVAINSTNFPDEVFLATVQENYDTNNDGYLSESERAITDMPLVWLAMGSISNLKGIEYFTSLTSLYAGDLGIETADLSALTNLQTLRINGNNLTRLDVSKNTSLTDLNCRGNTMLTSLTLSSSITKLQCDECALQNLYVSVCPNLTFLNCYKNEITTIDLSKNTLLEEINCSENHLKQLDLSACPKLAGKVTEYNVGRQTIDAPARFSGEILYVSVAFNDSSKLVSSNIPNPNTVPEGEDDTYTGYEDSSSAFALTDYDLMLSGIDYKLDTGAADSESMTVHINVTKDFYRVRYLTAQTDGAVLSMKYVNASQSCNAPAFPEAPQGMVCPSWSAAANNVTSDMDIFVQWSSAHTDKITAFANDTASIQCTVCQNSYTDSFTAHINETSANENYNHVLDVNNDGIINIRDLSMLTRGEY